MRVFSFLGASGQPQTELHPAAAAHSDRPVQDQTEAVWTLWRREEHPPRVPEMWYLT